MRNTALTDAMKRTGVSAAQLAKRVLVDAKTVNNWINRGAIPRRESQMAVAKILGCSIHDLWPDQAPPESYALSEIVNAWGHRSSSPTDVWLGLFESADKQIDLLGYAIMFLHYNLSDFIGILRDRACHGCQVRIVVADLDSEVAKHREIEQGSRALLTDRIRSSLVFFKPILNEANIMLRLQSIPMYNSIFRVDDDMFVTPHLFRQPGRLSPLLHLRRGNKQGIFHTYAQSFDEVFEASRAPTTTVN